MVGRLRYLINPQQQKKPRCVQSEYINLRLTERKLRPHKDECLLRTDVKRFGKKLVGSVERKVALMNPVNEVRMVD